MPQMTKGISSQAISFHLSRNTDSGPPGRPLGYQNTDITKES
jgi:hypothetical protein